MKKSYLIDNFGTENHFFFHESSLRYCKRILYKNNKLTFKFIHSQTMVVLNKLMNHQFNSIKRKISFRVI